MARSRLCSRIPPRGSGASAAGESPRIRAPRSATPPRLVRDPSSIPHGRRSARSSRSRPSGPGLSRDAPAPAPAHPLRTPHRVRSSSRSRSRPSSALPPWQPRAGRIGSSFGAVVQNPIHGPPVYAPHGPVRPRIPRPFAGSIAAFGKPAEPSRPRSTARASATARAARRPRPEPSPLGPVFYPVVHPVRAVIPQVFSKGRVTSGHGDPVRNPSAGPAIYPPRDPSADGCRNSSLAPAGSPLIPGRRSMTRLRRPQPDPSSIRQSRRSAPGRRCGGHPQGSRTPRQHPRRSTTRTPLATPRTTAWSTGSPSPSPPGASASATASRPRTRVPALHRRGHRDPCEDPAERPSRACCLQRRRPGPEPGSPEQLRSPVLPAPAGPCPAPAAAPAARPGQLKRRRPGAQPCRGSGLPFRSTPGPHPGATGFLPGRSVPARALRSSTRRQDRHSARRSPPRGSGSPCPCVGDRV